MYYVIVFLAGVLIGIVGTWIYKNKAIQALNDALNKTKEVIK